MKRILITHVDLDGTGCAIVFKKKYPDIEIEFRNYDTVNKRAKELFNEQNNYEKIYFADIVPTEKEITDKIVNNDKFVLIDHHITQCYLKDKRTFNPDYCGAYISSIYLFGNIQDNYDLEKTTLNKQEKDFIYAIDAWDTWKLKSEYREDGEKLNLICFEIGLEKFTEEFKNFDKLQGEYLTKANILLEQENKYYKQKISQLKEDIDEDGNKFYKVYIGESHSGVGKIVDMIDMEDKKYIAFINLNLKKIRLNSKNFDVTKVAQKYGGGGHKYCSGYTFKNFKIEYEK